MEVKKANNKRGRGFTLIEVLIAVSILAFALCGILLTYIGNFILSDLSRDLTLAINAVQARIEEAKQTNFDCLLTITRPPSQLCPLTCTSCFYQGDIFDIEGISQGKGRIEIEDVSPYSDLKKVRIIASFRSRGRIIGEDTNLNGSLDTGEDKDNNHRLDSAVEIITLITK